MVDGLSVQEVITELVHYTRGEKDLVGMVGSFWERTTSNGDFIMNFLLNLSYKFSKKYVISVNYCSRKVHTR